MNKVVDERLVPDGEYIDAMNIRMGSTENSEIGVIENTKGNEVLTALSYTDDTLLSTDAVCIGAIDDSANETLYWFVHDPNFSVGATGKLDLIVSFNVITNILTYHVISIDDGGGVNTTLNFNPSYLITGIDLVNNLLFFTDNYNPPRFININKGYANPSVLNIDFNGLPSQLRESILVIKQPPIESPTVQPIVTGGQNNYLEDRFICFAYRYRYADGEYSATSQWSEPAFIPNNFEFDLTSYLNDGMTNSCNAAVVTYYSGGPLVVGIDLLFKQADNNIIKVIEKLNKAELGIPDFTYQSFTFDNSKIFTVLPETEILRLYDNVPRLAKAQTIMGNRLMYGNYIEGYDLIDKYGNQTRLEYQTELVTEVVGNSNVPDGTQNGSYSINTSITVTNSIVTIDLTGIELIAGAAISLDVTVSHATFTGQTPFPNTQTADISFNFSFVLPTSYSSVYDMATSVQFQSIVGTAANIKPVYSAIIGDETSCDGITFTDQVNCGLPNILATANAVGSVTKNASGIDAIDEPIKVITSTSSNIIGFQFIAMQYVDDLTTPTQTVYEYYKVESARAIYQKIASPRSLHSNRGYEIGIVYMDEFNRATTALVSPYNTEHIACGNSPTQNLIFVSIPISQRAPAWAKRYKFVCKADAEGYETIYTNIFFTDPLTNETYFLLEGENTRKVETGDRLIVKRDTGGPTQTCLYATVLEKEAKGTNFITGQSSPAGVYMKINPNEFQVTLAPNSIINPGSQTTSENTPGDYPNQLYPMNIPDPSNPGMYIDYTIPAGSRIEMKIKWFRQGTDGGSGDCELRQYDLNVILSSTSAYDNMYDWFVGENVYAVLNTGTQNVGGNGCTITNTFLSPLGNTSWQVNYGVGSFGSLCVNYLQFFRDPSNNRLFLGITGTVRCTGWFWDEYLRRSTIVTKIIVYRADNTLIFETEPTDTLPDVFFENDLSFPIDSEGNHLSNGAAGDISQDITASIPGYIQTGFSNCFCFGNGAESYKIRDSIIGRTFNLGNRVTSVSAQDYKEASRFADITYSGVYNQETNVNKLNEFNLGLANFKNLETSFGPIQKMDGRETDILVLQEDKISYVLADKNLLSDSTGGGSITSVPEVLGTQIARIDKYGISSNPESYIQWGYDKYFTDVKRGAVLMLRGNSPSEQLTVISESNMRTWFRDTFITHPNNQMLGAFDPYMNEYVLCVTDRELPSNPQCISCGVSQAFTLIGESVGNTVNYCVELGTVIGETTFAWTVSSVSVGALFSVEVNYDGNIYYSGLISTDGQIDFLKSSNAVNTAEITILYLGDIVLNVTAQCPEPIELNIIEVVLTSDVDSGKSIHAQYRYTQGPSVGPLQSNSVLFQSSTSNPIVSRYNMITGYIGTGTFPPDSSVITLQTNQIAPDDYMFSPTSDNFKYLRSNVYYGNTPSEINTLIAASSYATPITGGPTIYGANFIVPSYLSGNYLYLIWDLRKSTPEELCYTDDSAEVPEILCCTCDLCTDACISLIFTNESSENEAQIYLSSGLCGEGTPVTITLDPSEITAPICITNAQYEVSFGSVSVDIVECGCVPCTENCTEYAIYTVEDSKISYTDCNGDPVIDQNVLIDTIETICVQIDAPPPVLSTGDAIIQATNSCGCCATPDPCMTFLITETAGVIYSFDYNDCNDVTQSVTLGPNESIEICGRTTLFQGLTIFDYNAASISIADTCNCATPCTEACESYTIVNGSAFTSSVTYTQCAGELNVLSTSNDPLFGQVGSQRLIVNAFPNEGAIVGQTIILFNALGQTNTRTVNSAPQDTPSVGFTRINFNSPAFTFDFSQAAGGYFVWPAVQTFNLLQGKSITLCSPTGVSPTSAPNADVYLSSCGCCTPLCQTYRIGFGGTSAQTYQVTYRNCSNATVTDDYPAGADVISICAFVNTVPSVSGSLDIVDWSIELIDGCGCGF
jgi:hypothetical protein